ncbi:uncharacterized protein LOC134273041 [Saccostrea cucullata]|uniref:uncharacterized protein LOC134273041 n=1 Tax=Saccostrea cuccullata TaxID=36930 RepID=UPI002ED13A9F
MDTLGYNNQCKVRQCSQCQGDTEFYCYMCQLDLCLQCKERHVTKSETKYHKIVFYITRHRSKNLTVQCKVWQCFQCQGDTEFYCNTCKHDLCLQCKERHVIDLDTMYHDVVIYRDKYYHITKQETCERHPDMFYQKYCHSCKLPICFQCTEHRYHQILDIRTAYITNRQKHRSIIQSIRSETLYNSSYVLAGIRSNSKTCHAEISIVQPKKLIKAQKLRNLIDTVMHDAKIKHKRFIQSLQQQRRKMNRHFANIETFEHRYDKLANKPLKFLKFLKKIPVQRLKDTPSLTQYALVCLNEYINTEDVTDLLGEIQIIETGKRQVRNECLLKPMSTPILTKSVTVSGEIYHISGLKPDEVWISDGKNLILINSEGDKLLHLTDVITVWGKHTVNLTGDLIYIDRDGNIIKLSKDNRTKFTLIEKTEPLISRCIYSSRLNGDLLVGMRSYNTGIITRFNDKGQHKQTIRHDNTGLGLYSYPIFLTENRNGDVIVSYYLRHAVVVTDSTGRRHRFTYKGHPSGSELWPCRICTDTLLHIMVCDFATSTIHMIDRDGHFLSLILTRQQGINGPMGLSYDDRTHLLWVGLAYGEKKVCVYRYLERQGYLQYIANHS